MQFIQKLKQLTTHKDRYIKGASLRLYRRLQELDELNDNE